MATQDLARSIRSIDIPALRRYAIGFDTLFDEMQRAVDNKAINYPPYNIVKLSDTEYVVELAVAGFADSELAVDVHENLLTVTGTPGETKLPEGATVLTQGISHRAFAREFRLAEHVVVDSAEVVRGLLRISLHVEVPEEKRPRRIAIEFKS